MTAAIEPSRPPQQGWVCQKCGSVYAPWVSKCGRCVPIFYPGRPK